ncbi:MAG: hypothetical protein EP329_23935 [Deltaproteobacteria bacterium]|nr:MAG: hypothetical protein EP329_23935 [Deltaproteobacteria bacterium]
MLRAALIVAALAALTPGGPASAADGEPPPPAEVAAPQDPGTLARPWALLVHGGLTFVALQDTPLGRQLEAADYGNIPGGPTFSIQLQRYVLDWLVVGGGLDLRYASSETQSNDSYSGALAPNQTSALWRVAASAWVQPTVCLERHSCANEGAFFGFQLGAGFGPTFWTLRDDVEVGWHVRFEAALVWQMGIGDVLLGFRLAHGLAWQSGLGPRNLGSPFVWVPAPDLQLGYRW